MLLSRLSSRPDLLSWVTMLSGDGLSVRLDEPAEAVVMANVVYALEPDYRRRLWPVLAAALEPGTVLSEEQLTGCSYHPAPDVLRHELAAAGFTPAQGAGDLLAWRRA